MLNQTGTGVKLYFGTERSIRSGFNPLSVAYSVRVHSFGVILVILMPTCGYWRLLLASFCSFVFLIHLL